MSLEKFKYYLISNRFVLLMKSDHRIKFLLILGLLLASVALAHGTIPSEKCNNTVSGSVLDVGRDFQKIGNHACVVLKFPFMFRQPPWAPGTQIMLNVKLLFPDRYK